MPADILCLSHLRWGFVYQRPNHLMSRFANDRRVFFVEEPVFEDAPPANVITQVARSLWTVVPRLPQGASSRAARSMQRTLLDELVVTAELRDAIGWFYTPMALSIAQHLPLSLTVYDCMDELAGFHGAPPELRERERELLERADVVFTGGHALYEAKRGLHPNVHAFPSSVDAAHFAKARTAGLADPEAQGSIPRPRIGYFGVVDERLDRALLDGVAVARPDVHFVVVGPVVKIDPETLPRRDNIHYVGQRDYADLPAFLAHWDVAMMPFARNDATRFISPTKTLEYLAAGRPVVSTPIRDVVRPFGNAGVVSIADDVATFAEAIDEALARRGTSAERARLERADALVAATSWDRTFRDMNTHLTAALARRNPTMPTEEASCSIT